MPFHRTVAWFPTVGAILGCALALLDAVLSILLPSGVTAVLLVVVWLALTGALHLDGLMDAADGLLCHAEPARRLEIMRDVAHGTFGIAAALGVVLTKYVSLAALAGGERGLTILIATVGARWAMVVSLTAFKPARSGLGSLFKPAERRLTTVAAGVSGLLFVTLVGGLFGAVGLVLATVTAGAVGSFAARRIGGVNGDVHGAIGELSEALILVVAVGARS